MSAGLLLFAAPALPAGWPSLSTPAAGAANASDAALIIGVERYASVPGVRGARQNADDWYLFLTKGRGIDPSRVRLLRDNEATLEKMRKYAAEAAAQVRPGGTLWFVFIGHGAPSRDGRQGMLVGFDAQQDADSLYDRSLGQTELMAALGAGKQARTVAVLDACFSGQTPAGALVPGLQPLIPLAAVASETKATLLLTAGSGTQFAGPLPGADRPAFSYLLLGALRGWADRDADGRVSAGEAIDYCRQALQALLKDRTQTPELSGEPGAVLTAGAREPGPDLAALVVASGAPAAGSQLGDEPAAAAQPQPEKDDGPRTVAISRFQALGPGKELGWLGTSFAEGLVTHLSRSGEIRVVEREFLDQILGELKLQGSGAVDQNSAVRAGRLLGAGTFVFGSVTSVGDQLIARARVVGVERGQVLGTAEASGTAGELLKVQAELARKIAAAMSLDPDAVAPAAATATAAVLALDSAAELERLRQLARGLPFYGLDPARARRRGDFQLALGICDRLLSGDPNLARAWFYAGTFSLQSGDLERAATSAEYAVQLAPADLEAWLLRANVLRSRRDLQSAMATLAEAVTRFPNDSRGWYALGRLQLEQGDKAGAVVSLLGAEERAPVIDATLTTLQTLLAGPGAATLIDEVRSRSERAFAPAMVYRAWFEGRFASSPAEVMATLTQSPGLPLAWYGAAQLTSDAGERERCLRRALALRPQISEIHRDLARLLFSQRRCTEGDDHLGRYLAGATVVKDFDVLSAQQRSCRGG